MSLGTNEPLWGEVRVSAAEAAEFEQALSAKRVVIISSNQKERLEYSPFGNILYHGYAPKGLPEDSEGWMIIKFTHNIANQLIEVNVAYGTWTGRTGLTYD